MKKWLFALALLFTSFVALGERYKELELFSHVLNFVESRYFYPVKMEKLIHGAIKGMLNELDNYSYFFTPDEATSFKNQTQDKAFILGMEVDKKTEILLLFPLWKTLRLKKQDCAQAIKL